MKQVGRWFLIAIFVAASSVQGLHAQANGARVEGIVSDPQNLPLPGVKLVLTEVRTGAVRTSETSSSGVYQFPGLLPGSYTLTAELSGFEKQTAAFVLEVDLQLRLDLKLELAKVTQAVQVRAVAPLLRREDP